MGQIENLEPQIQQDLQPQLQSLNLTMESLRASLTGVETTAYPQPMTMDPSQESAVAQEPTAELAVEGETATVGEPIIAGEPAIAGESVVAQEPAPATLAEEPEVAEKPADEHPSDPLTGNSKSVYPV